MSRRSLAKLCAVLASISAIFPAAGAQADGLAAPYRLAPGDLIAVAVLGQPDFSGQFVVEPSGTIPMPFVGDVRVEGRTLAECQAAIAARLSEGLLKDPAVGVRIQEFRPFYVMGAVRSPGTYAFRYGATVKSVVATAGGYGLPGGAVIPTSAAAAEYLAADERYHDLRLQRLALLVRQARLVAQQSGASSFEAPAPPDEVDRADLADLFRSEKDAFAGLRDALASQLNLLRSQKPRITREITAMKGQKAIEEDQANTIHEQAQHYSGLVKQGLGLATQDLQFKLDETTRRSNIMRLTADVSRLEMDAGEIDIKIADAQAAFNRQAAAELEDVRQRLKQVEVALRAAAQIAAIKRQYVGGLARGGEVSIEVSRSVEGRLVAQPASESTPLLPGDIVDVKSAAGPAMDKDAQALPPANLARGP